MYLNGYMVSIQFRPHKKNNQLIDKNDEKTQGNKVNLQTK